jgi:hypothetical protein
MRLAAHSTQELLSAAAVLLALAALAAFSLWGMRPSLAASSSAPLTSTQSTPSGEHESEREGR